MCLAIYIGLSLWYTASCQNASEVCKFHSPFSYPDKRLITYDACSDLSDRFVRQGWYGKEEHIIPTEPPGTLHCGTKYPIYLQERPPNSGAIETITACIQIKKECHTTINIQAVVCSPTLTVYKLARPSLNGASYCLAPSIVGEFPDFKTKTTIDYKLQNVSVPETSEIKQKEYEFTCAFKNPDDTRLMYKTQWFVDDESVYDSPFTNYEDTNRLRTLTDTRLNASGITTAGFQLRCEIRAGFNNTQQLPIPGLPSRSPTKFIGIEVVNRVLTIHEGGKAQISIKPSLEIGCGWTKGCPLSVTADIPATHEAQCEPTPVANGGCGLTIYTNNWNTYLSFEISSTATEEFGQASIKKKVFLRTDNDFPSHPLWSNYFLSPVTINIQKDTALIERRECSIYNDPYLEDFKKRHLYLQLDGTFTLLRTEENVEIQIQTSDCSGLGTGYCVCGVVVRVGRTAFMINRCNLGYWFIDYVLCDDGADILDVRKLSETSFQMYLPSGTKVNIGIRNWIGYDWLNIYIYPSIRDVGKTSGLCNELNVEINENDDLIDDAEFYDSWRVQKEDNMFIPEDYESIQGIDTSATFQHCLCNDSAASSVIGSLTCIPVPGTTPCIQDTDYTIFHKKRCISPRRRKRSVPGYFEPNISRHKRQKRDVSWKNKWTLKRADEHCTSLFNNSKAIERCKGLKGLDIDIAIKTCRRDIQLSGTEAFALSSISTVSSQCLYEARMNRTLREEKVEGSKTILELVEEVTCPGECSDQGQCEKGKCICNSGYIGSDCSLSVNKPPVAHNLEADGHCDLLEDDCTEVAVFGGRFVDHEKTKCQFQSFQIKDDKISPSGKVVIQTAVFESIGEVTCKVPARRRRRRSVDVPVIDETVTGYKVSVSNNGQNYSQQLDFIIYNTECMNCSMNTDNTQCVFNSDYCIMDSHCYKNGSIYNNGKDEYICNADDENKSWDIIMKPGKEGDNHRECFFMPYSFLYFLLC